MTTKAKAAESAAESPVVYDQNAAQLIPLSVDSFKVFHLISPLTDERYFALEKSVIAAVKRAEKLNTRLWNPKHDLWRELCTEIRNYPSDFAISEVDQAEAVQAINSLLHVEVLEADTEAKTGIYDPRKPKTVEFRCVFADAEGKSTLLRLQHSFRPDSKAQRDAFLAIETNQPNDQVLVSLSSDSKQQKLAELGGELLTATAVYFNDEWIPGAYTVERPPAWHLAKTTESFFARQIGKMGKSFEA